MKGIAYRLLELFDPLDQRGLFIDTSAGAVLGVIPGLEDFSQAAGSMLPWIDGLVCSPGQMRRLRR